MLGVHVPKALGSAPVLLAVVYLFVSAVAHHFGCACLMDSCLQYSAAGRGRQVKMIILKTLQNNSIT